MYRYVGLIWDPANDAATAAARDLIEKVLALPGAWSRVLVERGFAVLHSGAASGSCVTHMLAGNRGALCGRVFRRGSELRGDDAQWPTADEAATLVSSGGQTLLESFWGRYVAFIRNESSDAVQVLRDPTGALPCFITRIDDIHVVFSDLETVFATGRLQCSINWNYIAAYVPYSGLQIRATGLNEVTEVQMGERVTFCSNDIQRRMLWSPLDSLRRGLIEDRQQAVGLIREAVVRTIHSWASLHRSIVHNLSGGLDSSLVLACLKTAPTRPAVTCQHYFAPASREDERKYARRAASFLDAELIECALDPREIQLARLGEIRRAPRPWFYIYDLEQGPLEIEAAARHGATAIFSGAGGDGLFLQGRAELAVADYLRRKGFSTSVLQVALNAARITRTSVWPILRQGVRLHLKQPVRHPLGSLDQLRTLIPESVRSTARADDSLIHPWLADVQSIPPGLRWHIQTLSLAPPFYNSVDSQREVERTTPLFSQPLIELCLRIPSYVWISGGRDRSLVRQAFAADLPPEIVRRTQKGAIIRHNRKLMDQNAAFLRANLLDGLLVGRGLLDRERLEEMLSRVRSSTGFEYNEVLRQHLCTEMWLRQWSSSTSSSGR